MFGRYGPTLSDNRRRRFEADRAVLADVLPRMRHYIWASGEGAFVEGVVDVDIGAGCWEEVELRLDFGPEYPKTVPSVYDHGRRWKSNLDRHIVPGHEFCLWLKCVDMPDVATIAGFREFLLRLVPFLRDQFVFDDIGRWPGPEWPHGPRAAYAEHLVERLHITNTAMFCALWPYLLGAPLRSDRRCPCGSTFAYGRCHGPIVRGLTWVRTLRVRDELPPAIKEHLRDAA